MALVIEICIFYYLSVNRWQIRNASSFENAASLVPSSRMKYSIQNGVLRGGTGMITPNLS